MIHYDRGPRASWVSRLPWVVFVLLLALLSWLALDAKAGTTTPLDAIEEARYTAKARLSRSAVTHLTAYKPCPGGTDCSYARRVRKWAPKVTAWCMAEIGDAEGCAFVLAHTVESSMTPDASREGIDSGLMQFNLRSDQHLTACAKHFGRTMHPQDPEDATRCWAWRLAGTHRKLTCSSGDCKRRRAKVLGIMGERSRPDWWAVALAWAGTGTLCARHVAEERDGKVVRVPSDARCQSKYRTLARAIWKGGQR